MARTLTFNLDGNDKQLVAALTRAQKELKETGNVAEATGKKTKAGLDIKGALAGAAVLGGAKFAIGEAEQAQQTIARTAAVIKSTGNAAGVSAQQQDQYVQALSKTAAIDDEVIAGGANLLRTFTNVKGQAFQPALEAAVNLSAAMGTDLQGSIVQVGKALNDPIKGVSALTRVGVSFTAQQKEQIKTMVQAGDTAGAQKLILAELSKEFGGSAAAMATDSARAKVAIGNAAEAVGGVLAPAVELGAKGIGMLSDGFQGLPAPVQTGVLALGAATVAASKLDGALGDKGLGGSLTSNIRDLPKLGTALTGVVVGIGSYSATLDALKNNAAFKGDASGLATDLEDLGAGTASVDDIFQHFGGSLESFAGRFESIDDSLPRRLFQPGWTSDAANAEQDIKALDNALAQLAGTNPKAAQEAVAQLTAALHSQGQSTGQVVRLLPQYGDAMDRARRSNHDLTGQLDETGAATEEATKKWNDHAAAIGKVNAETDKLLNAAFSEFDANERYQQSISDVTTAQAELDLIRKAGDQDQIREAEKKLTDAIKNQVKAKGDQATATADANGKTLTSAQVGKIERDELDRLTKATGLYNDQLGLLVIRLQQVDDKARSASASIYEVEHPGPGTPQTGSAIPPTRDPDAYRGRGSTSTSKTDRSRGRSAPIMHVENLHLSGPAAMRDLQMELRRQEQRQARDVAVS